jgi:hypothetical protein
VSKLFGFFLLALACWAPGAAFAQGGMGPGPGTVHSIAAYAGPGDVVSGARMWWGLRAYSLATVGTNIANVCNSGDANCADVVSLSNGDFDVATATGAPLNCGGAGGTCTIKILYEQTGGSTCTGPVPCHLNTTTSAATRPILAFNCIGSKPCMSFTGTQFLRTGVNVISDVQPNTFSAVSQTTNTGANRSLVASTTSGANQLGYDAANNTVKAFAGSNLTATASAGSYHAFQAVLNGASSDMNVDGTPNTGNPGSGAFSGIVSIGEISGTQFMSGTMLEAGVWITGFNSTQSSNMSANQHSYWGF